MIAEVILWDNGLVMVFDDRGKQMCEYQGHQKDAQRRLRTANLAQARFFLGSWSVRKLRPCDKETILGKEVT